MNGFLTESKRLINTKELFILELSRSNPSIFIYLRYFASRLRFCEVSHWKKTLLPVSVFPKAGKHVAKTSRHPSLLDFILCYSQAHER